MDAAVCFLTKILLFSLQLMINISPLHLFALLYIQTAVTALRPLSRGMTAVRNIFSIETSLFLCQCHNGPSNYKCHLCVSVLSINNPTESERFTLMK